MYRVISELRKLCLSPVQPWLPQAGSWQGIFLASDSAALGVSVHT